MWDRPSPTGIRTQVGTPINTTAGGIHLDVLRNGFNNLHRTVQLSVRTSSGKVSLPLGMALPRQLRCNKSASVLQRATVANHSHGFRMGVCRATSVSRRHTLADAVIALSANGS